MVQTKLAHLLTKGAKKIQTKEPEVYNRSIVGEPQPKKRVVPQSYEEMELMRVLLDKAKLTELSYQNQIDNTLSSKDHNSSFQ